MATWKQLLYADGDGTSLSGIATSGHTHSYDNYSSWNLKTGGIQRTTVSSGSDLDIIGGTNVAVSYASGGRVTITSTDTDTVYTHPTSGTCPQTPASHTHSYLPLSGGTLTGALTGTNATFAGDVTIKGAEATNAYLYLYADEGDDNADKWRVMADTGGKFRIATHKAGSYTDALTINDDGRIGIGTADPTERLHLLNDDGSTKMLIEGGDGAAWMYMMSSEEDQDIKFVFQVAGGMYGGTNLLEWGWLHNDENIVFNVYHELTYSPGFDFKIDGNSKFAIDGTTGNATFAGDVSLAATKKLYLDGGSNTYIYESAGDTIKFVAGMGGTALTLTTLQATFSGSVQCGVNFKSSDGTSGANVVKSWEDPARDVHTVTIKDGLITSWVIA